MGAREDLVGDLGAQRLVAHGGVLEARWRGQPVRVHPGADSEALRRALESVVHLPDPVPVAEIDLSVVRPGRVEPGFVPVVGIAEGHALRELSGDSFLVILDRDSGDMVVLGTDGSGAPVELHHHLPRASLGAGHGLPDRSVAGRLPEREGARSAGTPDAAQPNGTSKLARLLPLLRCVRCPGDRPLRPAGARLRCIDCRAEFPVVEGVPILLADPTASAEPDDGAVSSNSYTRQALALFDRHRDGLVLDCGSGAPAERLPQVVHLERVRYPCVDVVASCERLPFARDSFDAALCESVLEHVPDPRATIAELHRVLKPGAPLRVDVPFLAPFHGYPDHYQNFTQSGLEHLLADFERLDGGIGPHQEPWVALAWMLRLARDGQPDDARRELFDRTPLGELIGAVDAGRPPASLHPLPDDVRRALAAGFYYLGRKPSTATPPLGPG